MELPAAYENKSNTIHIVRGETSDLKETVEESTSPACQFPNVEALERKLVIVRHVPMMEDRITMVEQFMVYIRFLGERKAFHEQKESLTLFGIFRSQKRYQILLEF